MARKRADLDRRTVLKGAAAGAAATIFAPHIVAAQAKVIRIGMPTILSGSRRTARHLVAQCRARWKSKRSTLPAASPAARSRWSSATRKGQPQEAARVARELVNSDGCEILLDAEASSGSFAVQEVAKDLGVLVHAHQLGDVLADGRSEDPHPDRLPLMPPGYSRCRRERRLRGRRSPRRRSSTRWATCSPDYAYGRDNTQLFVEYLKHFYPEAEVTTEAWPKLFQPDYTEVITKVLQTKPQALYSACGAAT